MRHLLTPMLGVLLLTSAACAAVLLPTMQEIQADFDAARYPECLQKIAKVINLAGPSAADYDRYALWTLKGETLLQQKNGVDAADAFTGARKAARDRKGTAAAAATVELIKKSEALQYTPRTGADKTPLPIADKARRPAALLALFNDELAPLQSKQKELLKSPALPPVVSFAPTLDQLSLLELAATATDEKTAAMKKELADHATEAIDTVLTANSGDVEKIRQNANQTYDVTTTDPKTRQVTVTRYKRGLIGNDRNTLDAIISTSAKLHPVCQDLAAALGADFKTPLASADDIRKKALDVENTSYGGGTVIR